MAWGRTSLAFLVAAMVLLRWMPAYGVVVALVAGGLQVVALVILVTQRRRYSRAAHAVAGGTPENPCGSVLALSACTVLLGSAGMTFVVMSGD